MDKGGERMQKKTTPLLEVKDFALTFRQYEQGLKEVELPVVHELNFSIHEGEIVAIVGASGSGKSLLADAILGILPDHAETKGMIHYQGTPLTKTRQNKLRKNEIAFIPQSVNALDPLMKVGKQVQTNVKSKNKRQTQQTLFRQVGLAKEVSTQYPFELSGGMQRRVLAATALGTDAKLIIADEPTPGLDPEVLTKMVEQMKQLVTEDKGMIFITHDIDIALKIADKIVVFNEGKTVEVAKVEQFTGNGANLKQSYTKQLWNALPQNQFSTPNVAFELSASHDYDEHYKTHVLNGSNLSYRYSKEKELFSNLDVTIESGEIVGMYGNSGAGKSTFAQIISGYKTAFQGEITIDKQVIQERLVYPVQLIWQHPEKVINPRWRMQKMLEEVGTIDEEILSALGIKKQWLTRWPSELSGGELQRFCLARALTADVKFLIADEITTMLDAITQAQIWQTIIEVVKKRNIGVLAISHDAALLNKISNRTFDFNQWT